MLDWLAAIAAQWVARDPSLVHIVSAFS